MSECSHQLKYTVKRRENKEKEQTVFPVKVSGNLHKCLRALLFLEKKSKVKKENEKQTYKKRERERKRNGEARGEPRGVLLLICFVDLLKRITKRLSS